MKYAIALLLLLSFFRVNAQEGSKDYSPTVKSMRLDLSKGLTVSQLSAGLEKSNIKASDDLATYFLEQDKNIKYFRGGSGGVDVIYEAKHLPDGKIYQLSMYIGAVGASQSAYVEMMTLKIAFNNSSKRMVEELGQPNKYYLHLGDPYSDDDYNNNMERALAALKSFNMVNSAQWYSAKYQGTKWAETPVIELSMHFTKRVRISVTDIELLKLVKTSS